MIIDSVPESALLLVPSCRECNSLLGAAKYLDFYEKRDQLKLLLASRYRGILKTPPWSPEQLAELSGSTRVDVERAVKARQWLQDRLDFAAPLAE